jgi:hypothetical protein
VRFACVVIKGNLEEMVLIALKTVKIDSRIRYLCSMRKMRYFLGEVSRVKILAQGQMEEPPAKKKTNLHLHA